MTALLQVLADSLRIWYTARRDTLLVRNKILEIYMLQLLQEIVHDSLPCVTSDLLGCQAQYGSGLVPGSVVRF